MILLARERELRQLDDSLERTLAGRATVTFVTGEAGSGKSALLDEFRRRAAERSSELVVATGVCDAQTGIADPYLPFREVLGELTGARPADRAAPDGGEPKKLPRWTLASVRALVEHGPDLVDLLVPGGAILTKLGTRAVKGSPWARRLAEITSGRAGRGAAQVHLDTEHVHEQYTRLLRAVAAEHPLVLVLDDLHWADAASAGLLFHLARRLEEDRILLLGAYRADDVALGRAGNRHPIDPVVNELQRYRGDMFVRLGEEPSRGREFVQALLAAEAPGVEEAFGDELFRHTGGHPLFTLELLRHLQDTGGLVREDRGGWTRGDGIRWSDLPARVEGVIAERAARLDGRQREALTAAAIEGREFTAEVVAAVLGEEVRDVVRLLSGDLEKRHRLVVARGVETVGRTRVAAYAFRHSLFQAWFYGSLDEVERVYGHEAAGRALETLHAEDRDEVAPRLARHFVAADRPVEAIPYLLTAGERAQATSADEEAGDYLDQAAAMLERAGPMLDEPTRREHAARIEEARGVLAELAGDHDAATARYREALSLLEPPAEDALSILRARIARRSAKPLELQRRHPEAMERLDLAERLLGPDARYRREWAEEWIRIQLERIWVAYWRGQTDVMEQVLEDVEPVLERWGRPSERSHFHYGRALLGMRSERYHLSDATLAASRAAYEAARRGAGLKELGLVEFGLGFTHLWRFELDPACTFLEQSVRTARQMGDAVLESRALLYRSVAARFAGDVGSALEWAAEAEASVLRSSLEEYVATIRAQRGWAAWRAGDLGTARAESEAALEAWRNMPYQYPLVVLAMLPLMAVESAEGRPVAAAALADAILSPPRARLREPAWSALTRVAESGTEDEAELAERLRTAIAAAEEVGYL